MLYIRRVHGNSMSPSLKSGDIVFFRAYSFRGSSLERGCVVLALVGGREVIKRVEEVEATGYRLVGDNRQASTDSRHYGVVKKHDIIGTMVIKLPRAVKPPQPLHSRAVWLGRIAATFLVVTCVVHLFRIDTFIPILHEALASNASFAAWTALVIVGSELFAIPFLLRMRLSPLAHVVSGALVALAPLWWLLVTIWAYNQDISTGQLGQFVETPATVWLLLANLAWVSFNYYVLYALGYNQLSLRRVRLK